MDFLLRHREAFVGFDMAGAEQEPAQWADSFRRAREAGLGITVHCAEDRLLGAPANALAALNVLQATRLGHGVQIHRDRAVMDAVRDSGALLELCVSSNYLTGAVPSVAAHPARALFDHGIRLSINTDDPGSMNCTLSSECAVWHDVLGFSVAEIARMNVDALAASFVDAAVKDRVLREHFPGERAEPSRL